MEVKEPFLKVLYQTAWAKAKKNTGCSQCLKITQNVAFEFLVFSTNFCPIEIDLSGNTVLPQTSVFLKVAKLVIFIQYVSVAHFARSVVK